VVCSFRVTRVGYFGRFGFGGSMMWVNCYETPCGPHYSRPYESLERAVYARNWFEDYIETKAKTLPPHRFVGSLRVRLKDPSLERHLQGGPTLFSPLTPVRKSKKAVQRKDPVADRLVVPPDYVDATALCNLQGRPWSRYWETMNALGHATAVAHEIGVPVKELVLSFYGGHSKQGTWVHPRIAEHLRKWLGLGVAAE
jgi:hypothetical protein